MQKNTLIIFIILFLSTLITRFSPFILLKGYKGENEYLEYLGEVLPPAAIGLLVVHSLRNIKFSSPGNFIPQISACLLIFVMTKLKRSSISTILLGTVTYMFLVQKCF